MLNYTREQIEADFPDDGPERLRPHCSRAYLAEDLTAMHELLELCEKPLSLSGGLNDRSLSPAERLNAIRDKVRELRGEKP